MPVLSEVISDSEKIITNKSSTLKVEFFDKFNDRELITFVISYCSHQDLLLLLILRK